VFRGFELGKSGFIPMVPTTRLDDTYTSTSAGSRRSISASRLENKATRETFSFKSDERAEKRK
jgi:hypothetical protein